MEVQAKLYYGLKTMARKFRKYRQLENIAIHLQNTPIDHRKEEDRIKALIGLKNKEGVARVVTTKERNVNVSIREMMKHCFKEEGKHQDGFSVPSRTEKETT